MTDRKKKDFERPSMTYRKRKTLKDMTDRKKERL